jgi:hypothetical protein
VRSESVQRATSSRAWTDHELFRRNCWISFEPVEGNFSVLADNIGPHKIMWPTDDGNPTVSSPPRHPR